MTQFGNFQRDVTLTERTDAGSLFDAYSLAVERILAIWNSNRVLPSIRAGSMCFYLCLARGAIGFEDMPTGARAPDGATHSQLLIV